MSLKIALFVFATLFALYVAWGFLQEFRTRSGRSRLGGLDSLLTGLCVASAAILPWVSLPWLSRTVTILTVLAAIIGLFAMRQMVRAARANKNGAA